MNKNLNQSFYEAVRIQVEFNYEHCAYKVEKNLPDDSFKICKHQKYPHWEIWSELDKKYNVVIRCNIPQNDVKDTDWNKPFKLAKISLHNLTAILYDNRGKMLHTITAKGLKCTLSRITQEIITLDSLRRYTKR